MAPPALRAAINRLTAEADPPARASFEQLEHLLTDRSQPLPLRRGCARALLRHGAQGVNALLACLQDPSQSRQLRRHCARVLAGVPDPPVVAVLAKVAGNSEIPRAVRGGCGAALATPHGLQAFVGLLGGEEVGSFVKWECARAATPFQNDPNATDELARALADLLQANGTLTRVRHECGLALGRIGGQLALETLLQEVNQPANVTRQQSAARGLGMLRENTARDCLISWLQHREANANLRQVCAESIGAYNGQESLTALTGTLHDENSSEELRLACVRGLGRIPGEQSFQQLFGLLQNDQESDDIRCAAVGSLDRNPASLAAFVEVLQNVNSPVSLRVVCARALGDIGGDHARDTLIGLLNDETNQMSLRTTCAQSLSAIGDPQSRAALEGQLAAANEDLQVACIEGLFPVPQEDAVLRGRLELLINDPDNPRSVRNSCATTLGLCSDEEILINRIEVFLANQFASEANGRPAGCLRRLLHFLELTDQEINHWLWETTAGEIHSLAWYLAALLIHEACDCPDSGSHSRRDYYELKCIRCGLEHSLHRYSESGLDAGLFLWRAVMGQEDPLQQPRGYVDAMLFPLLSPCGRQLYWDAGAQRIRVAEGPVP